MKPADRIRSLFREIPKTTDKVRHFFEAEKIVRAAHAENVFKTQIHVAVAVTAAFFVMMLFGLFVHSSLYLSLIMLLSTVCLALATCFSWKKKNVAASVITLTVVVTVMFTAFSMLQKDDGFSVLWLLLIPPIMIIIVNLKIGIAVSAYFLVMVIALFCTPLYSVLGLHYTDSFVDHFPLLYLFDYALNIYIGYTMFTYQYRLLEQQNALKEQLEGHLDQMSSKYENAEYRASHDVLTGLLNREHLKEMRAKGTYDHLTTCGIVYFDLNGLKMLNDTYGHKTGDEYIRLTADSIGYFSGSNCHAYRLGGDEFMMVVMNQTEDDVNELIRRWKGFLKQLSKERGMDCSVAVGSSFAAGDYLFDRLMKTADEKMYENKRQSKIPPRS